MSIKKLLDIQGFTRVVNGKMQYVRRHGRNQNIGNSAREILNDNEIQVLRKYQTEGLAYLNIDLNYGSMSNFLKYGKEIILPTRLLDSALSKLPDYITDQPLYRGITLDNSELEKILNNKYIITNGYFSTSKSIDAPTAFLNNGDSDRNFIIFNVKSNLGKDLSLYPEINVLNGQQEVLFPRGTVFAIKNVEVINKSLEKTSFLNLNKQNINSNIYNIELESIDSIKKELLLQSISSETHPFIRKKYNEKRRKLAMLRRIALNNNEYYLKGRSISDPKKRQAYYKKGLRDLEDRGTFYNINNITNF